MNQYLNFGKSPSIPPLSLSALCGNSGGNNGAEDRTVTTSPASSSGLAPQSTVINPLDRLLKQHTPAIFNNLFSAQLAQSNSAAAAATLAAYQQYQQSSPIKSAVGTAAAPFPFDPHHLAAASVEQPSAAAAAAMILSDPKFIWKSYLQTAALFLQQQQQQQQSLACNKSIGVLA